MTKIIIAGAGAFGTALAVTLDRAGRDVTLVGRNISEVAETRINPRLPSIQLSESIGITSELSVTPDDVLLLAVPMQSLSGYLDMTQPLPHVAVACCKGVDLKTGTGPSAIIRGKLGVPSAVLTGPSFAADIAKGLPTALTLATDHAALAATLQGLLSTETLRLYRSDDPVGAELGGALKNVVAIACGITMGAGLGESARAALMTRGYAEMLRLSLVLGAQRDTLAGLSGFGDLTLTCTSHQSRNFTFGYALGQGQLPPEGVTVEGRSTAKAVVALAKRHGLEMPITQAVNDLLDKSLTLTEVLGHLLSRPLRKE
ncbi:MAG: NAD(P)-dependent glycerol-3-phosphate dehydrogenase [Litoreibacter sp.]|nr:NAD(P)-dependent glycerol-3-phosphate dehydrogenase [Litoreibacter sp.]